MPSRGISLERIAQYFRECDLDVAEIAVAFITKKVAERKQKAHSRTASQLAAVSTPRPSRSRAKKNPPTAAATAPTSAAPVAGEQAAVASA